MRVIFYLGSVLCWVFFIYYGWQGFPDWFRKGVGDVSKTIPEITRQIPKEDWAKPTESKPEDKKPTEAKPEKKETAKSLFSGEFKLGGLRSRYNLDVPQNDKSEQIGKQDMGGK